MKMFLGISESYARIIHTETLQLTPQFVREVEQRK